MNKIISFGFRDMSNRYMVTADIQEGIFTVTEHSGAPAMFTFTSEGFTELRKILNKMYRERSGDTAETEMSTETEASEDIVGVGMTNIGVRGVRGVRGVPADSEELTTCKQLLREAYVQINYMNQTTDLTANTRQINDKLIGKLIASISEGAQSSEDIGYEVVANNLLYRAFHQLRRIGETVLLTTELAKLSKYIQADIREYLGYATPTDTEELATVNTEALLDELTNCTALLDKLYQHLHEMNIYGINNSVRGESTRVMERIVKQLTALKAIESGTYIAENKCAENKCADIANGRTL
jgi:hypothetical protein